MAAPHLDLRDLFGLPPPLPKTPPAPGIAFDFIHDKAAEEDPFPPLPFVPLEERRRDPFALETPDAPPSKRDRKIPGGYPPWVFGLCASMMLLGTIGTYRILGASVPKAVEPEKAATPTAHAPPAVQIPATIQERLILGGRELLWWNDNLTTLRRREDPEGQKLYALVKKRAEANGLEVIEGETGVKVTPSAELLQQVAERKRGD